MLFLNCFFAAFVVGTVLLSIVTMFLKSTTIEQRIAIGVSLLALLSIIFLPIFDFLLGQFNGIMIIKSLFEHSIIGITDLLGSSEWIAIQILLFASAISMAIACFYKKGGIIGGILMLCAFSWGLYKLSSTDLRADVGMYMYALWAVIACFTPLLTSKMRFAEKE